MAKEIVDESGILVCAACVRPLCEGSNSDAGRICLLRICQHMTLVSVRQVHVSALPGQPAQQLCLPVQLASQEQSLLKV